MSSRAPTVKTGLSNRSRPHKSPPKKKPPLQPIPFLTDLKSTPSPLAALSLFLSSSCPERHSYPAVSSLLYRLARRRLFPQIDTLLSFLKSHQTLLKQPIFNALIAHYSKARLPENALTLFHSLPSFNCPSAPSTQTFNHLLNALVDNGLVHAAEDLFARCRELGLRPNAVSYNIILKARLLEESSQDVQPKCLDATRCSKKCTSEMPAAARHLLDEMRRRRVRPSVVTYNILIGSMAKKGRLDEAVRLKEEMTAKPNAVTYALLMEGMCLGGKYGAARKLMFDMEYQGCKTGAVNYGVLMSDCGRRGDFDGMEGLMAEMRRRKMRPDAVMYGMMVNYLCGEGRVEEAYKVVVEMKVKGCEPGAAIYRMMVDGFCRAGEFEKGVKMLSVMLASGHCPRAETFKCLLLGLCEKGRWDEACFVLEEMERRGMGLEAEGWGVLIQQGDLSDDQIGLLDELTCMCFGRAGQDTSVV